MKKQNWIFFDGFNEVRTVDTGDVVFKTENFKYTPTTEDSPLDLSTSPVDMIVSWHNEGKTVTDITTLMRQRPELFSFENIQEFFYQAYANYYSKVEFTSIEPELNLTMYSTRNLRVIENFLLYYFAPDESKDNTEYENAMQSAKDYILEDHVDGEESEEAEEERQATAKKLALWKDIQTVFSNEELLAEFRKEYGISHTLLEIQNALNANMLKPKAQQLFRRLAKKGKK